MTFENLKCFISLAECLNFTRAAEKEHLTQTSMSRKINSIEDELGVLLFYRDNHQVDLTEAGREFYYCAQKLTALYDHSVQAVQDIHHGFKNAVKIGLGIYEHDLLSPFLGQYVYENPSVKISCTQYTYRELLKRFDQNTLDIILTSDQYFHESSQTNEWKTFLIDDRGWCLGVHKDHPLASLDAVTPPQGLTNEVLITMYDGSISQIIDHYKSIAVFRDIIHVNSHETKIMMINANLGVGFLPSFVNLEQYPEIRKLPFAVPYHPRRFYILCKTANPNLYVHDFFKDYSDYIRSLSQEK